MKFILSRYEHDMDWRKDYPGEYVIYDRSEFPIGGSIPTQNIGSDIYDKFTYIIDNYDNLPDVAIYSKANIFKYITKEEFEKVKDNKTFTPLLTRGHRVYSNEDGPVCFYDNEGMFNEVNNFWYLYPHPAKFPPRIIEIFKMDGRLYNAFAPGSNYILPKENILQHPKALYEELRSFLDWDVYPGDAQMMERGLYYLWKDNSTVKQ